VPRTGIHPVLGVRYSDDPAEYRRRMSSLIYHKYHNRKLVERQMWRDARTEDQRAKGAEETKTWRANPMNWCRGRAKSLKARAKKMGVPYSDGIIEDLQSQLPALQCICCGVDLQWEPRKAGTYLPNGPSVDKIIPALGYVPGNVKIVCMRCNLVKRDSSVQELRNVVAYIDACSLREKAASN
jgi:hypothetical protein